jgi:hypothetical protein
MNNSSQVLRELKELKVTWREQDLLLTKEQQERYDELLMLRRAFVTYWYENGMVHVHTTVKKPAPQPAQP